MADKPQAGAQGTTSQRGTTLLDPSRLPPAPPSQTKPFTLPTTPPTARWRLTALIGYEGIVPLSLEVKEQVIIGRPDTIESFTPDLDLSPFGARDKGVSRRHAKIVVLGDTLHICDLGSTNGTRVNGMRLLPHHIYRLNGGDQVECGALRMIINAQRLG